MSGPHRPAQVLVTGRAGFIGSCYVRQLLTNSPDVRAMVTLDSVTYAGRRENLGPALDDPRHVFVHDDICDAPLVRSRFDDYSGSNPRYLAP
ncbi:MAG: GDP-mannose 4,6-dehydratase [Gemmatimonadales bacterium]